MNTMLTLNRELAELAASSLCDVYTPEGDAVVIDELGRGKAKVTGDMWFPFASLTIGQMTVDEVRAGRSY